ncbi:ABC transporter ATP-binding protein (plasmid) [Agrobacterium sp. rho-13.3]|uniref:ABC transporter ATP-binding protein n=1 Tax=Agrobacterium sp. rho-13.3 TaxID=3072980 RepID=UPI002A0AC0FB|nr:ABC transporter ATP-binding protein [Agrobacterium sp. rho-13.3]MDX8310280.1 ABC transporter ATP-binding protein [Agrobacterium sp. rho-13.3]
MTSNIVEIRDVHKNYGTYTALENVNLSIRRGEIVTLLGPSGCGKSTLMRMVAGFEDPSKGEIFIAGNSTNSVPPNKRPVNIVFQRYALFPHLDVFDNIAFGLRVKGLSATDVKERVRRIISVVQLEPFMHRYIHGLSGGQCQRVALARALVNEPEVLLLDEPLAALDLKIRQHMLSEMKRIHEATGAAFLYVTHDQDEALFLSDRIVLMEKGKVLQIDNPQGMYRRPQSLFAAKFLGETNLIRATITENTATGYKLLSSDGIALFSPQKGTLRVGQPVTISIRPESISLEMEALSSADSKQTATARCLGATFMGSRTFLDVEIGSGTMLRIQRPGGADIPTAGSNIPIYWRSEDIVVLTD